MVFKWHKKSKLTKTERAIKTRGALILLVSRYTHHIYMKNNPMTVISASCLHNEHEMHTEICEIQLAYIFTKWDLFSLKSYWRKFWVIFLMFVLFFLCDKTQKWAIMIILNCCNCIWNHWSWHFAFYSFLIQMEVPQCLFHAGPWNKWA